MASISGRGTAGFVFDADSYSDAATRSDSDIATNSNSGRAELSWRKLSRYQRGRAGGLHHRSMPRMVIRRELVRR